MQNQRSTTVMRKPHQLEVTHLLCDAELHLRLIIQGFLLVITQCSNLLAFQYLKTLVSFKSTGDMKSVTQFEATIQIEDSSIFDDIVCEVSFLIFV